MHLSTRDDLRLLADSGATVAHCPTVFMRRGIALKTFGGYVREGINMGIGNMQGNLPHLVGEHLLKVAKIRPGSAESPR